jgi:hypothetical protein
VIPSRGIEGSVLNRQDRLAPLSCGKRLSLPNEIPNGDFSKQQSTLERLRDETAQAKALYEGAREVYDQAKKEYDDRIPNPPPEGLQRVMKMCDQNYRIALSRFNEYIFKRGK